MTTKNGTTGWTQNGESLTPDGKPTGNIYHLSVDYGRSVEDGVKAGRYDWVDSDITSYNFPTKRKGRAEVAVELINFNRYISDNEVFSELNTPDYRPAELHELLALGEKYPGVKRDFPVVALGSVWRVLYGFRGVPSIFRRGLGRSLVPFWVGSSWDGFFWFAAVRK